MLERTFATEPPSIRVGGAATRMPLGALLRRVAQMSPEEIAYRTLERSRIYRDRRRVSRDSPIAPDATQALPSSGGSFLAYLRQGLQDRFLFDPTSEHRHRMGALLLAGPPARAEAARIQAERLLAHEVELLGFGRVALGAAIDWHRDPLAGVRWPLHFWADYDLVSGGGPDPKVIHETARHGHLPLLGRAYYCLGEERYAREAVAQMISWIEQNPIGWGIHWSSSLELAMRVIAWITTLALIASSRALDESAARRIGASLLAQLAHVHRYPSLYSSPNTHLIGEAAALFLGGCFLPDAPNAARYRRAGAHHLEREVVRQVGEDGVYQELSTYYHAYALDFFLLAYAVGARARRPFSARYFRRLAGMAEFLAAIARSDGRIPLLGDDDGGSAFTLGGAHYHDVRPLLSSAAVLLERPDLFHPSEIDHALWLFGPERVGALEAACGTRTNVTGGPSLRAQAFPDAGYFIQTTENGPHAARLLFDAGQMGLASGGHGHADALQVVLDIDDRPFLVDPGTFVYNRAPEWRAFFRGTRAHNTVTVDDLDQSEPTGTFGWGRKAHASAKLPVTRSWCSYMAGEHDGYVRLAGRVRHHRRVICLASEYWLIVDELTGSGAHRSVWNYHIDPNVDVDLAPAPGVASATLRSGAAKAGISLLTSAASCARIVYGQAGPIQGWVSERYGAREAGPVLQVSADAALPLLAVTLIRPWQAPLEIQAERGPGFLVAKIPGAKSKDVLILNRSGRTVATPEGSVDAGLLWLRSERGKITHWMADDARGLGVGDLRLSDAATAGKWLTGRGYEVDEEA
jgi:hypothetical protein